MSRGQRTLACIDCGTTWEWRGQVRRAPSGLGEEIGLQHEGVRAVSGGLQAPRLARARQMKKVDNGAQVYRARYIYRT